MNKYKDIEKKGIERIKNKLSPYKFDLLTCFNKEESIKVCKVSGNYLNILEDLLEELNNEENVLLVSGYNCIKKNGDANVSYRIAIDNEIVELIYHGKENNIVSLNSESINLFHKAKKLGYNIKTESKKDKIEFNISGGAGLDTLSDLIWESENGEINPSFEEVACLDNLGILKKLNIYKSKKNNNTIKYKS